MKEQADDSMVIDHLERVTEDSNVQWRYHTVENRQVLQIKVDGEWDSVSNRSPKFKLNNHYDISSYFLSFQIK